MLKCEQFNQKEKNYEKIRFGYIDVLFMYNLSIRVYRL